MSARPRMCVVIVHELAIARQYRVMLEQFDSSLHIKKATCTKFRLARRCRLAIAIASVVVADGTCANCNVRKSYS